MSEREKSNKRNDKNGGLKDKTQKIDPKTLDIIQRGFILNNVFKIGNGGITDNFSSGSMYTFIKNGKIIVPAIDRDDNVFYKHPISDVDLIGYEIPNYDKVVKLVKECAKEIKEVKYVGWDVAIRDNDVCLIEGNCYPGIYQIKPSFLSVKEGLVKIYEHAMKIKIDKL